MQVTDITISDFKTLFAKDFPYLPVWVNTAFYNTGEEVYYDVNRLFYTSLNDGVTSIPTVTTDWSKTADSIDNYISDTSITNAFAETTCNFNPDIFTDTDFKIGFLYLAAHYLCMDTRTSMQGVMSKGEFNVASKGVSNVSESYAIPVKFMDDPYLNYFTKSGYGLKYLSILIPKLKGGFGIALGATT